MLSKERLGMLVRTGAVCKFFVAIRMVL